MIVRWKYNFSVLYIVLALSCTNAFANEYGPSNEPVFDPTKINATMVSDFPNEQLNVLNGNLEYLYRDVHIPGPNGMDVEVYRKFSQNYSNKAGERFMPNLWGLEIPKMYVFNNSMHNKIKCFTNASDNQLGTSINLSMHGMSFSSAVGYSSTSYLPNATPSNSISFSNNSVLECRDKPILRLADGRKIEFERKDEYLSGFLIYDPYMVYYPNKITDRFGNTITYTYETHQMTNYLNSGFMGSVVLLQSITSPDGHKVTFEYTDLEKFPRISKINYLGKSISYNYDRETNPMEADFASYNKDKIFYYYNTFLESVTDEEGRTTKYVYNNVVLEGKENLAGQQLHDLHMHRELESVELPQGAKITYSYEDMDVDTGQEVETNLYTPVTYNRMVKQKIITGSDIEDKRFDYARSQSTYTVNVDVQERKNSSYQVDKTTKYEFIRVKESKSNSDSGKHAIAGMPKSIKVYDGLYVYNAEVYEKKYTWDYKVMGTQGCDRISANYDVSLNEYSYIKCGQAVLDKEVEIFSGNTFTKIYSSHDVYGNPKSIAENYVNATYNTSKTYLNDTGNWLIGLEKSTTTSKNGSSSKLVSKIDYSYKSLPEKIYSEGELLDKTISYYSNGDINQITFNSKPGDIKYSNYKLGIAQKITVPDRYVGTTNTKSFVVNNEGQITKETDFKGNCISYTYDKLDRLKTTNYCNSKWKDVAISYIDNRKPNTMYNNDILFNNVNKNFGSYTELSMLDSLGRVKSIKTTPNNAQTTYQSFNYDVNGRLSFKSFPSTSSNPTIGSKYTYDVLGRIKTQLNTETGTSKKWDYLSENSVRYTDGNNKSTTTQYLRVGDNVYGVIKKITAPEGSSTSIVYDAALNPTSVTQNNRTQTNTFDSYGRLTKIVRNDTGTTNFGYISGKRLIDWETKAVGDAKIHYLYDNRGNLKRKYIATGATLLEQTLDAVGNLKIMKSTESQWSFDYNDRNLLEKETLAIDDYTFILDWNYDTYANISSVIYPDNEVINFNPNGLGQATKVGTYANNATFHPIGSLKSFTYGNGIQRSIGANAMGRINSINDSHESIDRNKLTYSYDAEHNLKSMNNEVEPDYSLTSLQYDGLHRLTGGSANNLNFNIQYNENNDITYKSVGDNFLNYEYDSNRLSGVNNGSITRQFSYDTRGNVNSNGIHNFTFNENNQMIEGASINFKYDGFGNRVSKLKDSKKDYFIYSRNGQLMYTVSKEKAMSYYYLAGQQIAKKSSFDISNIK